MEPQILQFVAVPTKNITAFLIGLMIAVAGHAGDDKSDPWQPVRSFIGHWTGTTEGEPGAGTVERAYEFILSDHFIEEHSTSTYPPQEKNKTGEVHHHMSVISYDRERKTLMMRQFHVEGFVNLYALNQAVSS